jgi:tRNA (guanine37-N1)-methyltransferase
MNGFAGNFIDDEVSIGDYILTGGELAAMVVIDAVSRFIPGVLGCADSPKMIPFRTVCWNMPLHPSF